MTAIQLIGRVILWLGMSAITLLIIGALILWFLAPEMCGNEIIFESTSPAGINKLVVFQRDCGATTGFSTQASILPVAAPLPNEAGNVFRSDTDHGAAPSGPEGGPSVIVTWQSPTSVTLMYHPNVRVFLNKDEASGVQVHYVTSANAD